MNKTTQQTSTVNKAEEREQLEKYLKLNEIEFDFSVSQSVNIKMRTRREDIPSRVAKAGEEGTHAHCLAYKTLTLDDTSNRENLNKHSSHRSKTFTRF